MIDGHESVSVVTMRKVKLTPDQRMAAKELLLSLGMQYLMSGGQLIVHFAPGRNAVFGEIQEREDRVTSALRKVS